MKHEVEMFKKHLEISRLLNKNGVVKPLAYIKENMEDGKSLTYFYFATTLMKKNSLMQ